MTMVAYTHSTSRKTKGERFKPHNGGAMKSFQAIMPLAHIPQTGTRETMCGRPMYEQAEVNEDAQIKVCKICQSRLQRMIIKFPGSDLVRSLLGNNLLPAADH